MKILTNKSYKELLNEINYANSIAYDRGKANFEFEREIENLKNEIKRLKILLTKNKIDYERKEK